MPKFTESNDTTDENNPMLFMLWKMFMLFSSEFNNRTDRFDLCGGVIKCQTSTSLLCMYIFLIKEVNCFQISQSQY